MDERRSDSTLTDAVLAQEIERALAVDPSPEFVARVRTRVHGERVGSAWAFPWTMVAASAAAAVIVMISVGVLIPRVHTPQDAAPLDRPLIAARPLDVPLAGPPRAMVPPRPSGASPESLPSVSPTVTLAANTEPEVLIAPGEAAALKRLMRGVTALPVDLSTPTNRPTDIASLQPLTDIVLAPMADIASITIEPLRPVAREEGVRQ
jgi:hypothetical protein